MLNQSDQEEICIYTYVLTYLFDAIGKYSFSVEYKTAFIRQNQT